MCAVFSSVADRCLSEMDSLQVSMSAAQLERERETVCVCVCEYLNIFLTKDYPELECHAKRLLFLVLTSQADLIKM